MGYLEEEFYSWKLADGSSKFRWVEMPVKCPSAEDWVAKCLALEIGADNKTFGTRQTPFMIDCVDKYGIYIIKGVSARQKWFDVESYKSPFGEWLPTGVVLEYKNHSPGVETPVYRFEPDVLEVSLLFDDGSDWAGVYELELAKMLVAREYLSVWDGIENIRVEAVDHEILLDEGTQQLMNI